MICLLLRSVSVHPPDTCVEAPFSVGKTPKWSKRIVTALSFKKGPVPITFGGAALRFPCLLRCRLRRPSTVFFWRRPSFRNLPAFVVGGGSVDDTTASGDQEDLPKVYYLGGSAPTTWLAP